MPQELLFFLRATPVAYGVSQARGWIRAVAASLHHSHSRIQAESLTYTTAHGSTGSLTHWGRPGIGPTFSWILVRFISTEPQWELLFFFFFFLITFCFFSGTVRYYRIILYFFLFCLKPIISHFIKNPACFWWVIETQICMVGVSKLYYRCFY